MEAQMTDFVTKNDKNFPTIGIKCPLEFVNLRNRKYDIVSERVLGAKDSSSQIDGFKFQVLRLGFLRASNLKL
jgi:hypothetical protein